MLAINSCCLPLRDLDLDDFLSDFSLGKFWCRVRLDEPRDRSRFAADDSRDRSRFAADDSRDRSRFAATTHVSGLGLSQTSHELLPRSHVIFPDRPMMLDGIGSYPPTICYDHV